MSEDASPLDRLPDRPLTAAEGDKLASQESASAWVRPESVIVREGDDVVVALMAVNRESGRAWLLGYDPEDGWGVVESWLEEELDRDEFYELLEAWEVETYGGRPEWALG